MKRLVKTSYMDPHYDRIKVTSSSNANRAVANCVMRMQVNEYGATVAEVYDDETGDLHAVVKLRPNGNLSIEYHRNPIVYAAAVARKLKRSKK